MRKNFLQDVTPPSQKRSIRDIPLPGGKGASGADYKEINPPVASEPREKVEIHPTPTSEGIRRAEPKPVEDRPIAPPIEDKPIAPPPSRESSYDNYNYQKPKKKPSKLFWIISGLIVLVLVLMVSKSGAEVMITPKTESIYLSDSFNINDKNINEDESSVGYKSLPIEKTVTTSVSPSGEEKVEQKASGKIKIINTDSDQKQALVKNTRFQTSSGLIYRINESIEVPGMNNGSPGTLEVEVFADSIGEEYNIEKTKFTIPGFKGLPQFTSITAESVTEMTGGFSGIRKVVSEADKEASLAKLRADAVAGLMNEISNIEDQAILVYNEADVTYSGIKETQNKNDIDISITATLNAYLFNSSDVAKFIADKKLSGSNSNLINLTNPKDIKFEIRKVTNEDEQIFTKLFMEGDFKLEWAIDKAGIKSVLANKKRNEMRGLLGGYESIKEASASISPFWKSKFPKASKIKITITTID